MRITGAGNVGIGTVSPNTKLNIKGDQSANGQLYIEPTNDGEYAGLVIKTTRGADRAYAIFAGGTGTDDLNFRFRDASAGADRMVIDSSGKVGIGTTSPSNRLHIQHSAVTTDQALFIQNTNGGGDAGIKFSDTPTGTQNGIFYYSHVDTSSNGTANSFHFNSDQTNLAVIIDQTNANSGYYIGESSPVVAIRGGGDSFFNGGNVGIGRTGPSNILDILKNQSAATFVNITNTTNNASSQVGVKIDSNSANNYILAHADLRTVTRYGIAIGGYGEIMSSTGNGLLIGTASNNKPIVFGNNNLERLRIDVGGKVGIGTNKPISKIRCCRCGSFH